MVKEGALRGQLQSEQLLSQLGRMEWGTRRSRCTQLGCSRPCRCITHNPPDCARGSSGWRDGSTSSYVCSGSDRQSATHAKTAATGSPGANSPCMWSHNGAYCEGGEQGRAWELGRHGAQNLMVPLANGERQAPIWLTHGRHLLLIKLPGARSQDTPGGRCPLGTAL